jgi:multiple sugar transport system permease protein
VARPAIGNVAGRGGDRKRLTVQRGAARRGWSGRDRAEVLARERQRFGRALTLGISYGLLVIAAAVVIFPVVWLVLTSFKSVAETQVFPPTFLPKHWTLSSYRSVFRLYPFARFLLNSFIISLAVTAGTLISCAMAAFALVHLRFRGREAVFFLVLATLIVPFAATMVPVFIEMSKLHWLNTWLPLIVPAFFGNAYGIFLLRQLFRGIPRSLAEAAMVDGANPLFILLKIYVPLGIPALTALGAVTFVNSWNNLISPLLFVNNTKLMPVAVGLAYLNGQGAAIWSWLMSGATVSMLPLLVMYALGQRYIVQGMTLTGALK